jgi:hypothetical protein
MTSSRAGSPPKTVHVRSYHRRGPDGWVDVTEHDRSSPNGGVPTGAAHDTADDTSRAYLDPRNVAKAQRQMEDYLTFFRQNAARDQALGVDHGWQLAVVHLEHFLDGTGTPVILSSEQVAQMPALLQAEEANRKRFENTFTANTRRPEINAALRGLADGGTLELADFWDVSTNPIHNRPGDYAAIGRSTLHSEGRFRAVREGDRIEIQGEVTHRLGVKGLGGMDDYYRDPYDFDAGQPGSFPAITLEHAGKARRFDMLSEPRRQRVTARVRARPDGRLELAAPPEWKPVE